MVSRACIALIGICIMLAETPAVYAVNRGNDSLGCGTTKTVRVEGREVFHAESEFRAVREKLLKQLLTEAVEQVNGIEILARNASRISISNEDLDEQHRELNVEKIEGLVKSYSFPVDGEKMDAGTDENRLNLKIDVVVCDETNTAKKIFVLVGEIRFRNFEDYGTGDLKGVVASAVPENSNILIVPDPNDDQYFDYTISGQILSVSATQEANALKALIGNVVRTGDGSPIVDSTVTRLSAIIALKAQNAFDGSYTVVNETVERKISERLYEGALAARVNEFIAAALQQASGSLYKKLQNREGFKKARGN